MNPSRSRRRHPAAPTPLAAPLPTSPVGVRLTDSVLAAIDRQLAAPEPEQGGALLRPLNGSAITHFEWDATASTTTTSYVPSGKLVERVAEMETSLDVSLVGVVHSHPNGMNRLSGPDLEVTRHLLQLNRHLGWVCMPIVTQLDHTHPVATHEVLLPHGRVSCFLARLDRADELHIATPASVRVIPVERLSGLVTQVLGWTPEGHQDLTVDGTAMIGCRFRPTDDDRTVWVLLSHDFPLAAPLVAVDDGDGLTPKRIATVADADADVAIGVLLGALGRQQLAAHPGDDRTRDTDDSDDEDLTTDPADAPDESEEP